MTWLDNVTGRGKIRVEPLEWLPLEFLCFNMRAIDREEIVDNMDTDNPLEIAARLFHALSRVGCGWIGYLSGRPAATFGVYENFPGNWHVFSFGTEDYARVLVACRENWDAMLAYALDRGMHRLECRSLAKHTEAHGFLRLLQFEKEAILEQYGRKRQDYILFRRLWADNAKRDPGDHPTAL